jgi:tetratricopeptide (TPR) repeat protein
MNHLAGVAQTCNQLAIVATKVGRLDEAERWYLRTIEIDEQLGNQQGLSRDYSNLASLYLSQNRLDAAARYARRALEIDEAIGDPSVEIWKDYGILAGIAEAQGRADEAAQWRRKEQESYAAYAGSSLDVQKWQEEIAIIVAACQGNAQAQEVAKQIIARYQDSKDWGNLVAAFRHILDGEHDIEVLRVGLDRTDYVIVHIILAQLAGEAPAPSAPPAVASEPASPGRGAASEAIARIREEWGPLIQAVVAACQGDNEAAAEVAPFLHQLAQQDDWRDLVAVLRRILAGERDPNALLAGLDDTDAIIAGNVLQALGVEISASPPAEEAQGMTLDDLLDLVAQACRPDAPAGLAEQLHALTRNISTDASMPDDIRALGRALNAVLSGERAPDLSALPPELADAVRELLAALQ